MDDILYYANANECSRKCEEFQFAQHLRLIKNQTERSVYHPEFNWNFYRGTDRCDWKTMKNNKKLWKLSLQHSSSPLGNIIISMDKQKKNRANMLLDRIRCGK